MALWVLPVRCPMVQLAWVLAGEIPDGSTVEADFDPDHPEKLAFTVK